MKDKNKSEEMKHATDMLLKERNFISAILETTGALVVLFDNQGRFIRTNEAFERITGFEIVDIVGKTFWEVLLIPEDKEYIKKILDKIMLGEFPIEYQSKIVARGGKIRSIVWSITALKDDRGDIEYIIGSGIDITENMIAKELLKETSQNLLQSERKYKSLVANMPGAIYRSRLSSEDSVEFLNNQIEEYIKEYSDAEFSHSICPECAQKLYPEFYKKKSE